MKIRRFYRITGAIVESTLVLAFYRSLKKPGSHIPFLSNWAGQDPIVTTCRAVK
ncbi:hypothetical protein YERSI8AC_790009 [Enterobacterales bacterium 8AC]|nr:hypothetical protein YERSI8AC_790009 [Enterobacterales bacterium 8AC]